MSVSSAGLISLQLNTLCCMMHVDQLGVVAMEDQAHLKGFTHDGVEALEGPQPGRKAGLSACAHQEQSVYAALGERSCLHWAHSTLGTCAADDDTAATKAFRELHLIEELCILQLSLCTELQLAEWAVLLYGERGI